MLRFRTTVTSGLNFFGWPLGGQDSTYDSSRFATKVRSVGLWFENYDVTGLSNTPRVYLIPAGADVLRSPNPSDFTTREWNVVDHEALRVARLHLERGQALDPWQPTTRSRVSSGRAAGSRASAPTTTPASMSVR